jgi:myo-inositol catabolism protein IolC
MSIKHLLSTAPLVCHNQLVAEVFEMDDKNGEDGVYEVTDVEGWQNRSEAEDGAAPLTLQTCAGTVTGRQVTWGLN